jgi:hypothetical protein
MKKWEYMIAKFKDSDLEGDGVTEFLNRAGKNEWEAFSSNYTHFPQPATCPDLIIIFLKREL